MRCVFSYPGVMDHAQQAALALQEAGELSAFATTFVWRPGGLVDRALDRAPARLAEKARKELARRSIDPRLLDRTISYGALEVARTVAAKAGAGPIWTDRIWDLSAHHFDDWVARTLTPGVDAVVAFEYTALASFEAARRLGKASVLHLPSLDSRAFKAIEDREKAAWPELRRPTDAYFDRKFEQRYARRCREVAAADVIIANSTLTKRSHVAAGADPDKIFVATLGAPEPIAEVIAPPRDGPLKVMWSGSFVLRKGAQYMLEAWRALDAGPHAALSVYGEVGVPRAMVETAPAGLAFLGSRPRAELMGAYEQADVLIFPTLSDGFGMSVSEALSRGLPAIVTKEAGAADLIDHGVNGLIVPAADTRSLTDALRWCLDNRDRLAEMRQAAIESVRHRQWSDYRREVTAAMHAGLAHAGFG